MLQHKETYLGDGLYASYDGYHIILRAPREGRVNHWVALEPKVMNEFFDFISRITNSKISVTPLNQET